MFLFMSVMQTNYLYLLCLQFNVHLRLVYNDRYTVCLTLHVITS